ncbi:hypothetical protein DWB84_07230 [Saccharophagus sp. K07]|nr:hypothetical protein [Saccharophagus sp. K07]
MSHELQGILSIVADPLSELTPQTAAVKLVFGEVERRCKSSACFAFKRGTFQGFLAGDKLLMTMQIREH